MTSPEAVADILNRAETSSIFERAVCLSLTLNRLGTSRKMNVNDLRPGVETNAEMVRASKQLIQSKELDAIKQHDGAIRRWLDTKVSGPALFRSGVKMISYEILPSVDKELYERLDERRDVLVPAFVRTWADVVENARKSLGAHFRADQYGTSGDVEREFSASVQYFSLGNPLGLEKVSSEIYERERQKAESQWTDVLEESRTVLRIEFNDLLSHMIERLEPDPAGKTKRFNATTIENLDTFLSNFSGRNIANDAALQDIIAKTRDAMKGLSPQAIRDSRSTRQAATDAFKAVKAAMDQTIVIGARRYDLD